MKNDIEVGQEISKVLQNARWLEKLFREGQEKTLFLALSDIERSANLAQNRLNHLRFKREIPAPIHVPPMEELDE